MTPARASSRKNAASAIRTHEEATARILALMPPKVAAQVRSLNLDVQRAENGVQRVRKAADAVHPIDDLAKAYPRCAALVIFRGFMKRVSNNFEEGIKDLSEGILRLPDEPQGYFWRATGLGALGRFAEAVADLDRAIALAPEVSEYYKLRGQSREKIGLLDAAIEDFNKSIELNPRFDWPLIGRSMCYSRQGRWKEALADLDKAIELNKKEEWSYLKRSLIRRQLGDIRGALEDVNSACEINEACDWVVGKPPFHEDELRQAVGHLDALLRTAPDDAWAHAWRGQTLIKLAEPARAEKDLTEALAGELGRGRGWVLAWRGDARRLQGRCAEAAKDFDEAIRLRPEYARSYYWRGAMHLALGEPGRALDDLRRGAELNDRMPEIHFLMGQAQQAAGRLPEALECFTRGLRVDPSEGEMLKARARVKAALGDEEGQVQDLCAYYGKIQVAPQDWRKTYDQLRETAGAQIAEKVWWRLPLSVDVFVAQAAEACEKNEAASALVIVDRAMKTGPGESSWQLHHWRGIALKKLGRLDEALASLNRGLSMKSGAAKQSKEHPRPAPVLVDPRIEFLGVVQNLIEPREIPEHVRKLAPDMADYLRDAAGRFKEFKGDPALKLIESALQEPAAYRWFAVAKLLLSASGVPELSGWTAESQRFDNRDLLRAMSALASRMRFMEFFEAHRPSCERWVSALSGAIGQEDFTRSVGRYLGIELKADYALIVSAALRRTSYSDAMTGTDGWVESRTIVCPIERQTDLRECLESPSPEALWSKGWHELCHVVMDAWAETHAGAINRHRRLYDRISGIARRKDWTDCLSEHLVLAPGCRIMLERRGPQAAKNLATAYKRNGYIYMDAFVEALGQYEAGRSRYPTLADFYPEWLKVLKEIKA
jgi:tetratricopeptide (TPR) repeat protein